MPAANREQLLHTLYEAAELEHNLMCTYLYAAWSLKDGDDAGVSASQAEVLAKWKQIILGVAVEEMSHLVSVWNITAALGGAPRIGRYNFPLATGVLPASLNVKLVPFTSETLQHFIFLERPGDSGEPDGGGFGATGVFSRGNAAARHTPMPDDYLTVGEFYASLKSQLDAFVEARGESLAFSGQRGLQIAGSNFGLPKAMPVICAKTARQAFDAIVAEGEGAASETRDSHYCRFLTIRDGMEELQKIDPGFVPAHPAATNPVLRAPPIAEGRVWLDNPQAVATVDLANAAYGLMLRAMAYAYAVPDSDVRKSVMLRLSIGLMRAMSPLAEAAARLPAGPSNPGVNAGVSFTALRDSAALPPGAAADLLVAERLREFAQGANELASLSARHARAAQLFDALLGGFESQLPEAARAAATRPATAVPAASTQPSPAANLAPAANAGREHATTSATRVEIVPGKDIEIHYEGARCIHARFCVTGAPTVFLANVKGPWIHPDTMPVERLVDIAHACPSGAIRYKRRDGQSDESPPPVNLAAIREAGPLAVRAELTLNGLPAGTRATLCRCGASKNKPYCDSSHKEIAFSATGEPPSQGTDMLPVRNGPLAIEPEPDGPLHVTGNLEITSGTGRIVARVESAVLCRCGGSSNKPFCDGTHRRIGFHSEGR